MRFFFALGLQGVKKVTIAPAGRLFFRGFPKHPGQGVAARALVGYGPAVSAVSTIDARFHARCCP